MILSFSDYPLPATVKTVMSKSGEGESKLASAELTDEELLAAVAELPWQPDDADVELSDDELLNIVSKVEREAPSGWDADDVDDDSILEFASKAENYGF